jgi:P4 family phage/plasmid primase-like protien
VSIQTILATLDTLMLPGDVLEVRLLNVPRVGTVAGYFDDLEAAASIAARWSGKIEAVYVTLNPVRPELLARAANTMVERPKSLTSDADIAHRRWLLIDLDPVRPSGISSTREEQRAALDLGQKIAQFLTFEMGWRGLLVARSGNGLHLLARVNLPNDDASRDLCKAVLEGLAHEFDTDAVKVDTTTYNAARICTLYGTKKCKGSDTVARPHRSTQITGWVGLDAIVPVEALERVAALAPRPEPKPAPAPARPGRPKEGPFDAAGWLARFPQIEVLEGPVERSGWTRWYVRCPWDSSHAGKDAYLSVSSAGAVTFHCSHNSCAGHDWAALRQLVGDNPPPRTERRERQPKPKLEIPADRIVVEPEEWRWTEVGNKERLLASRGDILRYDPERGWLVWDGRLWRQDADSGLARRACEEVLVGMAATIPAQAALDEDLADEWRSWCKTSATARMVAAVLTLAQADPRVRVDGGVWDRDLWCINTQNGILDLRTGELAPHEREMYCTRITSCAYDPDATAPLWEACLARWQPSEAVRGFLQRHAGYSLTGLTTEQTAILHYGVGKNGKTIFTGALKHVFGSYAGTVDHSALSDAKRGAGQANPEIARLVGLRYVLGTEIQQGVGFNEALIKDITGGDTVIARMLHTNPIEFDPQFALVLYGNHKPRIKSQDEGIWRRLPLVPWSVTIPSSSRPKRWASSPGWCAGAWRGSRRV